MATSTSSRTSIFGNDQDTVTLTTEIVDDGQDTVTTTTLTFDNDNGQDTVTLTFDGPVEFFNQDNILANLADPDFITNLANIEAEADQYLASNGDLIDAFGDLNYEQALDAATIHYIDFGFTEGRGLDNFNEAQYLNSFPDLIAAFGNDLDAATQHYIQFGFEEGRVF
ncbi:MAG: hypothetical protein AAF915_07655 [Cyanobacteria bacterium P01_D01_bin.50]